MNALLSIKPIYVEAILKGEKTVEFRRAVFKNKVSKVYIYSSSPVKKIVGYFTIKETITASPVTIWKKCKNMTGGLTTRKGLIEYFTGKAKGHALILEEVHIFKNAKCPLECFEEFTAPQNYFYVDFDL